MSIKQNLDEQFTIFRKHFLCVLYLGLVTGFPFTGCFVSIIAFLCISNTLCFYISHTTINDEIHTRFKYIR